MTGKYKGFTAHPRKKILNGNDLILFHCIIHQRNLCAKSRVVNYILQKIINIVNYIRSNATRHRQFREMLSLDGQSFSVALSYHSKILLLSQGQVLVKILNFENKLFSFLAIEIIYVIW
ncbi:SCAN domain-containing protein 3 [Dictyocoela muelleri]|nr:SCAN domain-containing protein 3 [Dictyocoela muelleri]